MAQPGPEDVSSLLEKRMLDPNPAKRPRARLSADWLALIAALVIAGLVRAEVIGNVPW